jgi:uncharacterized protein
MPRPSQKSFRAGLALALLITAGCERGDGGPAEQAYTPPVTFGTASARVMTGGDTLRLTVEVAERDDQRSFGLMERTALAEDAGMVFLYGSEQSAGAGFWMYRTLIPLDIGYFDDDGTFVAIVGMDPCLHAEPARCRTYEPGVAYHGALEVNRGWFARHGVGLGDRIVVDR